MKKTALIKMFSALLFLSFLSISNLYADRITKTFATYYSDGTITLLCDESNLITDIESNIAPFVWLDNETIVDDIEVYYNIEETSILRVIATNADGDNRTFSIEIEGVPNTGTGNVDLFLSEINYGGNCGLKFYFCTPTNCSDCDLKSDNKCSCDGIIDMKKSVIIICSRGSGNIPLPGGGINVFQASGLCILE